MWIRSQDKRRLLNVNLVEVDGKEVRGYQHAFFIGDYSSSNDWGSNNDILLGKYETEERALEVLDVIHQNLITCIKSDRIINGEKIVSLAVYQMPKE